MKRSQANGWAAGVSPEMKPFPVLRVFSVLKAALSEAKWRVEGETGGVVGRGTFKEDDPVTRETPFRPTRSFRATENR